MQSLFIGLGAVVASALRWVFSHWLGVSAATSATLPIPATVRHSFYMGAAAFLGPASWTVWTTHEHPPGDLEAFVAMRRRKRGIQHRARAIFEAVRDTPTTMRRLA